MTATEILTDAWRLYRLLFRRSIVVAAAVMVVVTAVDAGRLSNSENVSAPLSLIALVLGIAGTVIIQGALIELVRNVHEGRKPVSIDSLLERVGECFWSLIKVSLIYGFGVALGIVLFIVPGLIIAARWSLMAPLVVLEGVKRGGAARSSSLVVGKTKTVLLALLVSFVITAGPSIAIAYSSIDTIWVLAFGFVWSSLTAPFQAHLLTVIYYRIVDPERPVIAGEVRTWASVWDGA
jgi:hypothetical protein